MSYKDAERRAAGLNIRPKRPWSSGGDLTDIRPRRGSLCLLAIVSSCLLMEFCSNICCSVARFGSLDTTLNRSNPSGNPASMPFSSADLQITNSIRSRSNFGRVWSAISGGYAKDHGNITIVSLGTNVKTKFRQ